VREDPERRHVHDDHRENEREENNGPLREASH
jgi:hypothetical protein